MYHSVSLVKFVWPVLFGRVLQMVFQIAPQLFSFSWISWSEYSCSASRNATFTLFHSSLKAFQSSLVPIFRTVWCRQSPSFIICLTSLVINGFGLCHIFTVLRGAWFSKQVKNNSLNASSLSSTESLRLTVSDGIWVMSVANWSAL